MNMFIRAAHLMAVAAQISQISATPPVHARDAALTHRVKQPPVTVLQVAPETYLIDFGRVAFGNLLLATPPESAGAHLTVRFGESLKEGRINRNPSGSVRFAQVDVLSKGNGPLRVAPPPDWRNTHGEAVLTPSEWGVLLPFRWVEVLGWPGRLKPGDVLRLAAFDRTWSDDAATFRSSNPMLDRVWDLCHYSIKATTFAGIFVDGDRERVAYEADAYLTQLGYYAGDADPRMARATFERLITHPTWPTEWGPQMVFMAYADWMETGDRAWLRDHYEALKPRLLSDRVGSDGLVTSSPDQTHHGDIVDWPQSEGDGYAFTQVNTVVNAFHLRALAEMAELAEAVGKRGQARRYRSEFAQGMAGFQRKLFDPVARLYRDGTGTDHISLHANLFPLAFGLVRERDRRHVAGWLAGRGMAGSVYAAQYLLEALFENGQAEAALDLITAPGDRSWRHMVDSGATITWEAWDQKYKPNQDWNHAWGAAPAALLPRFVLGARPLTPGWTTVFVQPHPGSLRSAEGAIPTPRGTLHVSWINDRSFIMTLALPQGIIARVELPAPPATHGVWVAGKLVKTHRNGAWWVIDRPLYGTEKLKVR